STVFTRMLVLSIILGACSRASLHRVAGLPAPQADTAATREWKSIHVNGSYGSFDMLVPVVVVSSNEPMMIDSVALQEIEKRMTSRIARIARAEAEAVNTADLLGTIEFNADSADLTG